jgi:hypothetical protein
MQTELKQFTSGALEKLSGYSWRVTRGNYKTKSNAWSLRFGEIEELKIISIRNLSAPIQSSQPKVEPAPEGINVSILGGRRRAIRTPTDRRDTTKFRWQQTKSGSDARLNRQ